MGKFRTKSKTGKNRQRWKKGSSSSSNPKKSKHRDAAKARLMRVGFGGVSSEQHVPKGFNNAPARLTAESLLKHDALMGNVSKENDGKEEDIDAITLGQTNKTFDTFASSVWSECSNVSFGRLLPRFNPSNPKHKEMLAILSAIAEVIKENHMGDNNDDESTEPSGVEYFGALLTSLDTADTSEGLSATIALLSIVIKTIDKELLRAKFSISAKLLFELLSRHGESDDPSIVRGLLGCLSVLLRSQETESWKLSSTIRYLDSILLFAIDRRPKVRKAAQHAICSILATKEDSQQSHPASDNIAKFLNKLLETHAGGNDSKAVLHVLILLKEILFLFSKAMVKSVCESILSVMNLGDSLTQSCSFQALHGLFAGRPSSKSLPAELNAQLISALYEFMKSINDSQPMIAWLTVMQEAHINLAQQDPKKCLEILPKFFLNATKCWRSDRGEVSVAATAAIKAILNEALRPNLYQLATKDPHDCQNKIKDVFTSVENGLTYQFYDSWAQVLNVLTTFFEVCGQEYHSVMGKCLKSLAELRSSANFTLTNELDYVIGKAIRTMGPEIVIKYIPLPDYGAEESYDFPRSWLLPVLRENIQNANLSFFKAYFLPKAMSCQLRADRANQENDKIGQKSCEMLVHQIWSLLPGFCNNPKDLKESFGDIVKEMGKNLQNRKDLRMYILASLRQLILKNLENEVNKEVLSQWAKKFLDTMCTLYIKRPEGAEESGQRLSIMETIRLFLQLVNPTLLQVHFDSLYKTISEQSNDKIDDFTRDACHDLMRVMLKYQDYGSIEKIYKFASSAFTHKDHKKQKKAYKLLEEICVSESEASKTFLESNLEDIQKTLLDSLSKASPPSQASRIKCLINIIKNLEKGNANQVEFLYKIVPEAILCTKAANEKARSGSYTLLVVIGETLQKWRSPGDDVDSVIKDYMKVVLAGLAGGPTMIHCTLKSITKLYYEFQDIFPEDLTNLLIENVCLLLTSHSREIVNPSVSFLHVFITTSPVIGSAQFCEKIVSSLCKMTEDCKRHFRLKTRYLFDRLVRKFGYDVVKGIIPKDDEMTLKRLKNIRKIQERKKKKDADDDNNDADSDDESEFRIKSKPKTMDEILAMTDAGLEDNDEDEENDSKKKVLKRKKKSSTYIAEEANGDTIVDFLDTSAAQKVRSSKPNVTTKASSNAPAMKKKNEFELTPDGRLIIKDSDDDEEMEGGESSNAKKGYILDDSDDGNGGDTFETMVSTNARKRKRGGSVASSKISEPAMKYKAGGTGIHRPLNGNSKNTEYGSEYRATKAKGDMKRKGKPDPYAYVPLQKSALNRRKKAKFEGQFRGLVKAAEKGSSKGKKSKAKSLSNKMKHMKMK